MAVRKTVRILEQNQANQLQTSAAGQATELHWTIDRSIRSRPHQYSRMQAFLANPGGAKAYLSQHCSSEVIDTSIEPWVNLWSSRWSRTDGPGRVNACLNATYFAEFNACALSHLAWCTGRMLHFRCTACAPACVDVPKPAAGRLANPAPSMCGAQFDG